MKKKMGRPTLPKGEAKGEVFSVRVAANEAGLIQAAIRKSGLKKPEWARQALVKSAKM